MVVTPLGPISLPLSYAENSIASSAIFQTWAAAADEAAAKDNIFLYRVSDNDKTDPVVTLNTGDSFGKMSEGSVWLYNEPVIIAAFRSSLPEEVVDDQDAMRYIDNQVGQTMAQTQTVAETAGYLDMKEWMITKDAYVVQADEDQGQIFGRHCGMEITMRYWGH